MSNSFKVRCVSVTQDGRHIHVRFAQPGAGHFALVFPETDKDQHEYSPGKEYVLSVNTAAHSFSLSENDEAAKPDPYRHEHPEEGTFPHIVTQETLDQNPDMAVQGVEVGDTIQVPVGSDLPPFSYTETDDREIPDADYQKPAAEETAGFPAHQDTIENPKDEDLSPIPRPEDIARDEVSNEEYYADKFEKFPGEDVIDGETEVPTAIEPENPQS